MGWLPTKDYTENEKMPIEGLNPPWAFFLGNKTGLFPARCKLADDLLISGESERILGKRAVLISITFCGYKASGIKKKVLCFLMSTQWCHEEECPLFPECVSSGPD